MVIKRRALSFFLNIVLVSVFLPKAVYAYLDPGSGSFIFQIIVSAVLGSVVLFKTQMRRAGSLIKRIFKKRKK